MRRSVPQAHPLRRMFAAVTEQTFAVQIGVADPPLIDYLSNLLARFVNVDNIYSLRNAVGKRLDQVADMLLEANERVANARRESHRHIGDFTLFWTGVFPEALSRIQGPLCKDHLVAYCEHGKRSYYIASTFRDEPYEKESVVLRRLSDQFELCAYGLSQVRSEWEKMEAEGASQFRKRLLS